MRRLLTVLGHGFVLPLLGGLLAAPTSVQAAAPPARPTFARDVRPFLARHCNGCHGGAKPKAGLALDRFRDEADVLVALATWEKVADNLRSGDMPPPSRKRPSEAERDALNHYLDAVVFRVDCNGPRDPGRVTLRRLNRAEYDNTIRDLVGIRFQPARDFPSDDVGYGFDNIGDVLSMPPILLEKYLAAAEQVIDRAFQDSQARRRLLPAGRRRGAVREALRTFATRAYRRPVTDDELRRLMDLTQAARLQGDTFEAGVKMALQAVLVSPHFLFRVELDADPHDPKVVRTLTDWELASRLSYFLWSSMPDEELFQLARQNGLRRPGVLEAQVRRMLRDPKSRALVDNFASQWLQTRNLKTFTPDPERFPAFNEQLREAMQKETDLFVGHIIREDRSILELLDADYTFVNERLARHYGLPGVKGETFRKVSLAGTPRGGILTHASILAITSNPTRTSPVKRGKWILETIFNTPPPPPPPGVEELQEGKEVELKGTLRQRMEQHRSNPSCATCHQRMDPLGFGFENFDAVGAWRTRDGHHLVDASGVLPGGKAFRGPVELRAILKGKREAFTRCLAEKLLTYALGRGVERSDHCTVDDVARAAGRHQHRFSSLVIEIVKSDPFQKRRGKRGSP